MNVTAYKKFVVVVGFKAHFSLYTVNKVKANFNNILCFLFVKVNATMYNKLKEF